MKTKIRCNLAVFLFQRGSQQIRRDAAALLFQPQAAGRHARLQGVIVNSASALVAGLFPGGRKERKKERREKKGRGQGGRRGCR